MKKFDEPKFMEQLEALIEGLRQLDPLIEVRRLREYPGLAGDTLVWYFKRPSCPFEVQVDPPLHGMFLISTDERNGYEEPETIEDAVAVMKRLLYLER